MEFSPAFLLIVSLMTTIVMSYQLIVSERYYRIVRACYLQPADTEETEDDEFALYRAYASVSLLLLLSIAATLTPLLMFFIILIRDFLL